MANTPNIVKQNPVGINDDFSFTGMIMNNVVEKGKEVLKAIGTEVQNLSTELIQGMSIKVYPGGKPTQIER